MQGTIRRTLLLRWSERRAIEIVLDEVARQFEGEDPLRPKLRTALAESRRMANDFAAQLSVYGEPVEFTEPPEDLVSEMRQVVDQGKRLFA